MDESNVLIKQMPMSVEAEQAVLGAIIIKPESFDQIAGLITANDFYLEDHKRIYSTLIQMYGESKIIDTVTLVNNPLTNPAEIKIDAEKAKKWLANGAQPTETVKSLLKKSGIVD